MFLIALIVFLFILSFLVFVHEFGHFIVAKRAGMLVEEFGFGYPPRIWSKKVKETTYSINALPFGGFVRIKDEENPEHRKASRGYYSAKPWQKTKMLLAGVIMNLLVGILLYYIILAGQGFKFYLPSINNHQFLFGQQQSFPTVSQVLDESVASKAGLKPYDAIISSGNLAFKDAKELQDFIKQNANKEIAFDVKNVISGEQKQVKIVPAEKDGQGFIGVGLALLSEIKYATPVQKTFSGVLHSIGILDYSLRVLWDMIKMSFVQGTMGPLANSVVGPVGILAFTDITLSGGIWQILNLIAMLSLGFALVNVLPIPAADGGKMLFVIYEAIFKKQAPEKFERNFNIVGNIFIIVLSVIIAIKDLFQFFIK